MKTYIALFRGINVGGNHSLPMKTLVGILESLGAKNVRTYIQSGNAVFQSPENNRSLLCKRIAGEIKKRQGFEPCVLLLELAEFKRAMKANPFPEGEENPASLHLSFLSEKPEAPNMEKLASLKKESERFHLGEGAFYLHAPEGIGRSKLAASAEKLVGVPMTDRNWRTVCKLIELAEAE